MKLNLLLILTMALFIQCKVPADLNTSSQSKQMPSEPGKCYAKCQVKKIISTESYFHYDYEIAPEDLELEKVSVVTEPAGLQWVKKKTNANCKSADPNDCLVWCQVEKPAKVEEFMVVKDTSQTLLWKLKTLNIYSSEAPSVEWREVLCADKLDRMKITLIQNKLDEKGYYTGMTRGDYQNPKLKSALTAYQNEHNLPVGNYDIETMKSLGIDY